MADRNQAYDARRRQDSPTRALYGTQRWRRKAARQLLLEPLCRTCQAKGRVTAASVADHIVPHRGDVEAFWSNELQSLCKWCHDVVKQREEARGHSDALDGDGWPVDPRHPANGGGTQAANVARPSGRLEAPPGSKSLGPVAPRPAAPLRAQRREMSLGGRNNG
jgi:5-methylcytosine-specific restriction protein A